MIRRCVVLSFITTAFFVAAAWVITFPAWAQEPVLLARSGPADGFRMPANTGFADSTVDLNNNGQATIRITSLPPLAQRGIWLGDVAAGAVVVSGSGDWLFTDSRLNDEGRVAWTRTFSTADGIYQYDPLNNIDFLWTTAPFGSSGWGSPAVNNSSQLGYRASFANGQVWVSWAAATGELFHAIETGLDPASPYAFLFTPAFNNNRQIAGKARLGGTANSQPDQILRTESNGVATVLAQDADALPGSLFTGFDNSVAFNDGGEVAFIANLTSPSARAVFRTVMEDPQEVAREGENGVASIEFFAPRMNNSGLVVFRAIDDAGNRAIWLADGISVTPLVTAGDVVMTDIGPARIQSPTGGPVFSGGIDVNDNGEVAFVAVLTEPDNANALLGLGLFLQPALSQVIFTDGFEGP